MQGENNINKRTLFLKSNSDSFEEFYNKEIIKDNCDVLAWDKIYERDLRGLLKAKNIYKNLYELYVQGVLKKYDRIIVFDDALVVIILSLFVKGGCSMELWMWNTLNLKQGIKIRIAKLFCNVWTFDEHDAEKYHIGWNTQFYFPIRIEIEKELETDGIYFVGADKGRFELLKKLTDYCREYEIHYNFNMVRESGKIYPNGYDDILCNDFVEYPVVLKKIKKSKIILDLTKKNQTGMTVRVLEAVYYNKGIITDNRYLLNAKFYDPDKIFILGYDSIKRLQLFVHSACEISYSKHVLNYYSFHYWLGRFEDGYIK